MYGVKNAAAQVSDPACTIKTQSVPVMNSLFVRGLEAAQVVELFILFLVESLKDCLQDKIAELGEQIRFRQSACEDAHDLVESRLNYVEGRLILSFIAGLLERADEWFDRRLCPQP
jgi:hypothetical protein